MQAARLPRQLIFDTGKNMFMVTLNTVLLKEGAICRLYLGAGQDLEGNVQHLRHKEFQPTSADGRKNYDTSDQSVAVVTSYCHAGL